MYNLAPTAIIHLSSNWYNAERLLVEIFGLRKINFSIVEARQQALERLNKLVEPAPFGKRVRFRNGLWICESLGDWTRKFQQLKLALSFKDVDSQKTPDTVVSKQDSLVAFWNATTAFIDAISCLDNVYDRDIFESYYCSWQNGSDDDQEIGTGRFEAQRSIEKDFTSYDGEQSLHRTSRSSGQENSNTQLEE